MSPVELPGAGRFPRLIPVTHGLFFHTQLLISVEAATKAE